MDLIKIKRPRYLRDIQEEMNRVIESAFEDLGMVETMEQPKETLWRPAIELNEQNGNYQLKAELPGVHKEDIDIELGDDAITIKAETEMKKEEEKQNIYRSEFRYGKFIRSIQLPSEIDNNNATAEFKEGVLTVTMPKIKGKESKTKKLTVQE